MLPVVAEQNASGGVTLHLTNEECTPSGGSGRIGRATEVMVSNRGDFDGATWQPFTTTKVVKENGNVFVRYRDSAGRQTEASTVGSPGSAPLSALTTESSLTVSVPGFTPGGTSADAPPTAPSQPAQPAVIAPTSGSNFVVGAPRP